VLAILSENIRTFGQFIEEVRSDWFARGPRQLTRDELARIEREADTLIGSVLQAVEWARKEHAREARKAEAATARGGRYGLGEDPHPTVVTRGATRTARCGGF
jgi:hypothetical protein